MNPNIKEHNQQKNRKSLSQINIAKEVIERKIEDELSESYLQYSMSVIVSRALPDIRDGCKPVQRRILYAMYKMNNASNRPHKKCLRICGEVSGKYHPYGDFPIYDALVRMTQTFNSNYPLLDGQGNFGSIDGDSPAAARYTEARLSTVGEKMLEDIEKETVNFVENYDGTEKMPEVLPGRLPGLLINGASGIAVGMATNIPPHNIIEVLQATKAVIKNPDLNTAQILDYIKGPDFPNNSNLYFDKNNSLKSIYELGQGLFVIRAPYYFEEEERQIIFTDIPYQANKALIVESIDLLSHSKKIKGVVSVQDESDKQGIRLAIKLSFGAIPKVVVNQLFKMTNLERKFHMNFVALVGNTPTQMSIKQAINEFINHRLNVISKKTKYNLIKEENKLHILEGISVAIKNIEQVIKIVKESDSNTLAKQKLKKTVFISYEDEKVCLTSKQADAILDLKVSKLTSLESNKIRQDIQQSKQIVNKYKSILLNPVVIRDELIKDIDHLLEEFHDNKRKTQLLGEYESLENEELIMPEEIMITLSKSGYIKAQMYLEYNLQNRGGKGKISTGLKESDIISQSYLCSNKDTLLLFSSIGKVYKIKAYEIPISERTSKGKPAINFIPIEKFENITCILPLKSLKQGFLVMISKLGRVKRVDAEKFTNIRYNGIRAINLEEKDELLCVLNCSLNCLKDLMLFSLRGKAVRFNIDSVRSMGRTAKGVKSIILEDKQDAIVTALLVDSDNKILAVTKQGLGKITQVQAYRKTNRRAKGVISIKVNKDDSLVGATVVDQESKVIITTEQGVSVKIHSLTIRNSGRVTKGVKIIKLKTGDCVKFISESKI